MSTIKVYLIGGFDSLVKSYISADVVTYIETYLRKIWKYNLWQD